MIPEHATLAEYFSMGGYWPFIWPSYALGLVLLVALFWISARRLNAAERALGDAAQGPAGEDDATR